MCHLHRTIHFSKQHRHLRTSSSGDMLVSGAAMKVFFDALFDLDLGVTTYNHIFSKKESFVTSPHEKQTNIILRIPLNFSASWASKQQNRPSNLGARSRTENFKLQQTMNTFSQHRNYTKESCVVSLLPNSPNARAAFIEQL